MKYTVEVECWFYVEETATMVFLTAVHTPIESLITKPAMYLQTRSVTVCCAPQPGRCLILVSSSDMTGVDVMVGHA